MGNFDAYHKWLGIPPEEQPPHYYRLLGVGMFESDPDVIDAAASRQAAYLKTCVLGPHVELTQKLLSEVAIARWSLLNPDKKAAYDERLRAKLHGDARQLNGDAPPAVAAKQHVLPPGNGIAPPICDVVPATVDRMQSTPGGDVPIRAGSTRRKTRPPAHPLMFIVQIVLGGAMGLVAGYFLLGWLSPNNALVREVNEFCLPSKKLVRTRPVASLTPAESPRAQPSSIVPDLPRKHSNQSQVPKSPALEPLHSPREFSPPVPTPQETKPPASVSPVPAPKRVDVPLDFSRQKMRTSLPDVPNPDGMDICIEEVKGFGTPHEIQPDDGRFGVGKVARILLTDFRAVNIGVSLTHSGDDVWIEMVPEVEVEPGKRLPFTEAWIKRGLKKLKKDADKASDNLEEAKNLAATINAWLKSPVMKPLPLKNFKSQELQNLKNSVIPRLERMAGEANRRCEVQQELLQIVEAARGVASVVIVVRREQASSSLAESAAPSKQLAR